MLMLMESSRHRNWLDGADRMKKLLIALTVVIGALTTATSPAMAHATSMDLPGRGYGIISTTNGSHTYVGACDKNADGWGVRTYYWLRSGGTGAVGDANGSATGCGGRSVTTTSNPVVYYQVCAGPNGSDSVCTVRATS
jgi:hypothetical protein